MRYIPIYILSFFINLFFWIKNWKHLRSTLKRKKVLTFRGIDDVRAFMGLQDYEKDKYRDWMPWVITALKRGKDDCDGLAVLGKWALSKIGIKARLVRLEKKGSRKGHMICVAPVMKVMVSNKQVINFAGQRHWLSDVFHYFNGRYDIIDGIQINGGIKNAEEKG